MPPEVTLNNPSGEGNQGTPAPDVKPNDGRVFVQPTGTEPAPGAEKPTEKPKEEPKGSTPQELQSQLDAAKAKASEAEAESERAKRYIVQLVQRFQEGRGTQQQQNQPSEAERAQAIKDRLEEDPQSVLDEHFNERMTPLLEQQLRNTASSNRQLAKERLSGIKDAEGVSKWDKYEKEVDEFMKPLSLETQAQPGAWENAFQFIRSQHLDDEIQDALKAQARRDANGFVEGSGSGATSGGASAVKPLSTLEKQIAAEYGMSDEEWRKYGGGNFTEGNI